MLPKTPESPYASAAPGCGRPAMSLREARLHELDTEYQHQLLRLRQLLHRAQRKMWRP